MAEIKTLESKLDQFFDEVLPNLETVGRALWLGCYTGRWKFNLRKYPGDLHDAKKAIRESLQKLGFTEEEVLEDAFSTNRYFLPMLSIGCFDDMEDTGEDEQKRCVLGLCSGLLVEKLLKENSGVLILDDSVKFGYHIGGKDSPLIRIPFYEGLAIEYDSDEKGLIFQIDFPVDPDFRFSPFHKCKNLRIVYCHSTESFLEESENCDSVKLSLDEYKHVVKKIASDNKSEIKRMREY